MNYKESGVDTQRGYELVERLKRREAVQPKISSGEVLAGIGGFASLYALAGYSEPVLVSGADGIGTKLKLALDFASYESIGQDCVAMCVNDVICTGAQPLFFLDYLACDKLDTEIASALIGGVSAACERIGIPLIGGETAEMPGFYRDGLYDMAGFCIGAVERSAIRSKELVRSGDVIIGLMSSGLHSNGFSLVRKILGETERLCGPLDYEQPLPLKTPPGTEKQKEQKKGQRESLKELLLEPTTIYAPVVQAMLRSAHGAAIHSMTHITGGGIYENLPRALAESQCAEVWRNAIPTQPIFDFIRCPQRYINGSKSPALISDQELWRTFNMGLGFAVIAAEEAAQDLLQICKLHHIEADIVGRIRSGPAKVELR